MTNSLIAILGFSAWTLLLLAAIACLRGILTLRGIRYANSFAVSGEDVSPFSARLCRAHANCYENLPVFVGILSVAAISGQTNISDPLALWVLLARLCQSTVHLISTRNRAVLLRFSCLSVQWIIQIYWIWMLVQI